MFSHAKIERNAIILLVLTLITVSIGGLVEIVPLYMIESTIEPVKGVRPYSPLELAGRNIRVNALSPTAGTRMTEGLIPEQAFELLTPECVTPAALYLVSEDAPNKTIVCAGAGGYAITRIVETDGVWLAPEEQTPEGIAANWEAITSPVNEAQPQAGFEQTLKFVGKAAAGLGIEMS